MIYLWDVDGTLTDPAKRLHHITGGSKRWDLFYSEAKLDKPIFETITVARALNAAGHINILSTGRPESVRFDTAEWMHRYRVPFNGLYMRKDGDHREDFIVKSELLDQIMVQYGAGLGGYGGAFEDRQQVVDMYRKRGLRVFQVAPGNF